MSQRSWGVYKLLERPAVYERFQRLLGAHGARTRFVKEFLRAGSGARLLDIGCGTGSLLDYLPAGIEYVGFDLNPAYIEAARLRYGKSGSFYCAEVGEKTASIEADPFDFIVAKSILHHLTDDEANHLLRMARRLLKPGGTFVSSDSVFHEDQSWIARTLISLDRGRHVRTPEVYRRLVESHFSDVKTWLLTDMLPIPYSHYVIRAASLQASRP